MCQSVSTAPQRKRLDVEELSSGFLVRDFQTDRAFFASDAGSAGIIVTAIMRAGNPPGGLADARNQQAVQPGARAAMAANVAELHGLYRPTSEAEQQAVEGKHNAAKDLDPRKAPEDAALDEAVRLIDAVFDKVDAAFERFLRRR